MPQHGFDKNLIRRIFFFNIQRGDPLDFQKRFLQCGGNFARKKNLQNQKFLHYVQECPVKCLWLKSKIAHLSPTPNNDDNDYDIMPGAVCARLAVRQAGGGGGGGAGGVDGAALHRQH